MQNMIVKPLNSRDRVPYLVCLVFAGLLVFAPRLSAIEDPPGCSLEKGGNGNTSQGGIGFTLSQAHVGDLVEVVASLGMVPNACRATNATGVIYIASGLLTNFLVDVTLAPGDVVSCPANGLCSPGPYRFLITPDLVGASVDRPLGGALALRNTVRAVEAGFGTVLSGDINEQLNDIHTTSIRIVTPCIQVFTTCDLPPGQTCFSAEAPVRFRGYVTNCGDINLTNVTVVTSRTGQLTNTTTGLPLLQPLTLETNQAVFFSGDFAPELTEICAGSAPNTITVRGTDTTVIGGPNASVTNSTTVVCDLCVNPCLTVTQECAPTVLSQTQTLSGGLTNCGNITITNIVVSDDIYGAITTIASLAPHAFTNFSVTFTATRCGTTTNIVTATGGTQCGVTTTARATNVCTVTDLQNPVITCPGNLMLTANAGQCSRSNVTFTVSATDYCSVTNLVSNPPSGSTFPVGVTTVTSTATDASGNQSSCTFTVTVTDTQNPVVTCSSNLVLTADAGQCSRSNVAFTVSATDNCSVTNLVSSPASGSTFPVGVTTVTSTATDASGNTTSCSFTVTVTDTENPLITCSRLPVLTADPGECGRSNVTYAVTATDNCSVTNLVSSPPSGSTFPIGTTVVTTTATDASGNQSSCSFAVTVIETQNPVVTCSSNLVLTADTGQCSRSNVTFTVSATDNCSVTNLVSSPASGSTFAVGVTTVTNTAMDASGNQSSCTFTVTVTDTQDPVITCPGNLVLTADAGRCSRSNVSFTVSATDNCSVTNLVSSPASGSTFPVGVTTVTNTATDASGNQSSCSFTVTVTDTQNPVITCSSNLVLASDAGGCNRSNVTFTVSVTDNCSVTNLVSSPASGSTFPVGVTTVTSTATDASGNATSCSFTVTVTDTENPLITCPRLPVLTADPGQCSRSNVTYAATATDNCSVTNLVSSPASGSTFPIGTTVVITTATDASGNQSSCSFAVIVTEAQSPVINCSSNLVLTADAGRCSRSNVTFIVSATDNCSVTNLVSSPASGSTFPVGVTTVTNTAMDASGNQSSCTFTVTVTDTQDPVITCPGNLVVTADADRCSRSNVTFTVSATDNCSVTNLVSSPASGSTFPVGVTTVTNTATDASGNQSSCSFTVTVTDTQNPVITCSSNLVLASDAGGCNRSNVTFTVSATDNCSVTNLVSSPASGSTFPVGVTTVTSTATDASGNTTSCSFTVTVTETQSPGIICSRIAVLTADAGQCSRSNVTFTVSATDNCSVTNLVSSPPSGSTFPVGVTTVTSTATDASGNQSSCTFTVTVTDTQNPVIICSSNLVLTADAGQCSRSNVTFTVSATDNCSVTNLVSSPASGSTFPVGVTTVTSTATDASGNQSSCSFTVTVTDPENPVVTCPRIPVLTADAGQCSRSNVTFTVSATDNCSVTNLVSSPPSGSTFPIGTTTVTSTATDASGNQSSCTFTVTVIETQNPAITCPSNLVLTADAGQCSRSNVAFTMSATDNCSVTNLVSSPPSGSTFPVGVTTVTSTATDASGNQSSCTFTVTVQPNSCRLACPPDVISNAGPEGIIVHYPLPVLIGECSGGDVICTPPSGSTFLPGTNIVRCQVIEAANCPITCSFAVIVVANCPLVIRASVVETNTLRVRQTGLFYQTVGVTNPCDLTVTACRLYLEGLSSDVQVYNASGVSNGVPYLQYNLPIPPQQGIEFAVEYYVPNRRTLPNPTFRAEVVAAEVIPNPAGTVASVLRALAYTNCAFLVEFSTLSNRTYYVQYTSDVITNAMWKTAVPAAIGNGTAVQWLDSGPPKTESPPCTQTNRYYRVVLVP